MVKKYTPEGIKVLTRLEAVRKRPGMYFGDPGDGRALNNALLEVVANSVDQYLLGFATIVRLTVDDHGTATVFDDGHGMRFDKVAPSGNMSFVEHYLTTAHDTATADGHAPHIHLVGGGLGLAVVNAASQSMLVESSDGAKAWVQEFGRGQVLTPVRETDGWEKSGTKITLSLDEELFGAVRPDLVELRKAMFELAHFYPGLIVEFQDERFHSVNGLLDLAQIHHKQETAFARTSKKFFFHGKLENIEAQVAALGETDGTTKFLSWVNGVDSVLGGTHVIALRKLLERVDWIPSTALIHVVMHDPKYAGPCKDALQSEEVIDVLQRMLSEPLLAFVEKETEP